LTQPAVAEAIHATRGLGSAAKYVQAKPSKNAWIGLVLFVRIGTFQRVTVKKIRNSSPFSAAAGRCAAAAGE
jgi:hypothetical protein